MMALVQEEMNSGSMLTIIEAEKESSSSSYKSLGLGLPFGQNQIQAAAIRKDSLSSQNPTQAITQT